MTLTEAELKFIEEVRQLTPENKMILELAIHDIQNGLDPKPPEEYRKMLQEKAG